MAVIWQQLDKVCPEKESKNVKDIGKHVRHLSKGWFYYRQRMFSLVTNSCCYQPHASLFASIEEVMCVTMSSRWGGWLAFTHKMDFLLGRARQTTRRRGLSHGRSDRYKLRCHLVFFSEQPMVCCVSPQKTNLKSLLLLQSRVDLPQSAQKKNVEQKMVAIPDRPTINEIPWCEIAILFLPSLLK